MKKVPCARFSTRHTPKISDSPDASRKRIAADTRPLAICRPISIGYLRDRLFSISSLLGR